MTEVGVVRGGAIEQLVMQVAVGAVGTPQRSPQGKVRSGCCDVAVYWRVAAQ